MYMDIYIAIAGQGDIYSGASLCTNNDVVYVSINYRLGIFGESILSIMHIALS